MDLRTAAARPAVWIAKHELEWLLLTSPLLLFPTSVPSLTALALLSIPLLWLCRWRATGRLTRRSALDLPILGLMITLPLAILVSSYPALSLPKATGLTLGIAVYYALVNRPDALRAARWLPWLGLGVVALGFLGIDWVVFKIPILTPIYQHLPRVIRGVPRTMQGGFHPNEVGSTLAMLIPLVIGLWPPRSTRQPPEQAYGAPQPTRPSTSSLLLVLALVPMGVLLLLTQSRTAIAAAALALLLMGALLRREVRVLALILVLALSVALVARGPSSLLERLLNLPGSHTWAGRPEIWRNALRAWQDYPFTGLGLNAFTPVSRARYTYLTAPPTWDFVHAHNLVLQAGVDFGALGMLAFLAFCVVFFLMTARLYRVQAKPDRLWTVGLMASMAAYLAFGAIDAITLGAKPAVLVWFVAGMSSWTSGRATNAEGAARHSWRPRLVGAGAIVLLVIAILLFPPLSSRALSNWGHLAIDHALYPHAIAILQQAVELDGHNLSARYGLAEAYAGAGREAEALLTWRAAGIAPVALAEKGEATRRAREMVDAERWLGRALTLDATLSDAWYYLGLAYQDEGQEDKAVRAYREALAYNRFEGGRVSSNDAQRALGILLVRQGQPGEATAHFRSMLEAVPGDIKTRFNLAQALSQIGDYDAAHRELLIAIQDLEAQQKELGALAYSQLRLELAIALTTNANRRDDLAEAIRWAGTAKRLEPRHTFPYTELADLYVRRGMRREAISECQALLQVRQDAAGVYYLLGLAYAGAGQPGDAVRAYQEALRLRPDVARFHYALAEALAAMGDAPGAERSLSRAKAMGPDAPLRLTGHNRLLSD